MEGSKKLALLVGCNYPNTDDRLSGCHNDVTKMRTTLITKLGFKPDLIQLLTDAPGNTTMPTGANIKRALNRMIDQARPGDVLFFHFSGHGMMLPSHHSSKKVEAIVPCDSNLITSVDFRHLVDRVPEGATFTILADSCNSGGLIDKETEQIGPHRRPSDQRGVVKASHHKLKMIKYESMLVRLSSVTGLDSPDIGPHLLKMFGPDASLMFGSSHQFPKPLKPDQGILLSGCQSDENSQDLSDDDGGEAYGAFSNAVEMVFKENDDSLISNRKIVMMVRKILEMKGIDYQHPCLYCSKENADAIFLCKAAGNPN